MTQAVRLDAGEAHISVADAARMRDHPQLRKYLMPSHVSHPSFSDGIITIAKTGKKRVPPKRGSSGQLLYCPCFLFSGAMLLPGLEPELPF